MPVVMLCAHRLVLPSRNVVSTMRISSIVYPMVSAMFVSCLRIILHSGCHSEAKPKNPRSVLSAAKNLNQQEFLHCVQDDVVIPAFRNHYPTTEQQDKRKSGSILDRCAHGRV